MKIFVISPVRKLTPEKQALLEKAVGQLQYNGHDVHVPFCDTDQDVSSVEICMQNRKEIEDSDVVAIWFDKDSEGSLFDLGMVFAYRKPLIRLNHIIRTPDKSIENLILDWGQGLK